MALPGVLESPLRPTAESPGRWVALAAAASQLALHFMCFFSNISTLVVYWVWHEPHFFWPLCTAWLTAAVPISWAALRELQPRAEPRFRLLHWLKVVLIFGVLRGLQVRHIVRFYRQRRTAQRTSAEEAAADGERPQSLEQTAFNSKTFDGILEGFFFALGNQFAFFMLDKDPPNCNWYMTKDFIGSNDCIWCVGIRFLFLFSALCSMLTLAAAIVEVDYRVSTDIRRRINTSTWYACVHFAYRASEVVLHLSFINLVCIFLRTQPKLQGVMGPYLLYMPVVAMWLLSVLILHKSAMRHDAEQEFLLAHAAVALASVAVNPTQFVDRPVYRIAAQATARRFFFVRWIELILMFVFVCTRWNTTFPCNLEGYDGPRRIGHYTLWWNSNHRLAYMEIGIASLAHFLIFTTQPYVRRICTRKQSPPKLRRTDTDPSTFLTNTEKDNLQMQVRKTVPRGLSSFLVQAGTGVTSRLFANKEYAVTDFDIEGILGMGTFGVVVKVQARWRGGEPLPEEKQLRYAMKLQNVSNHLRATYAEREREYLVKLNAHNHPFIMQLVHFFDVSPDEEFHDVNGRPVKGQYGISSFHKALMMEYCPLGDLEAYLLRSAREAPSMEVPPPMEALEASLAWLDTARRLSAQLVEAVRFLHLESFTHRDLKPGNVLLKSGPELHVCLADFGFARQLGPGSELKSVAGDTDYMAPEIRQTYLAGDWTGQPYTSAVDIYSLGKTILVMLWAAKCRGLSRGPAQEFFLQLPSSSQWERWSDSEAGNLRVPLSAKVMIGRMMQEGAANRSTAAELARDSFFQVLEHQGMQLPALDYSGCRRVWRRA